MNVKVRKNFGKTYEKNVEEPFLQSDFQNNLRFSYNQNYKTAPKNYDENFERKKIIKTGRKNNFDGTKKVKIQAGFFRQDENESELQNFCEKMNGIAKVKLFFSFLL